MFPLPSIRYVKRILYWISCEASFARSDSPLESSCSKRFLASVQSFLRNGICARLKRAFQNFGSIRAASCNAVSA